MAMNAQAMRESRRRDYRWNHWESAFHDLRALPFFHDKRERNFVLPPDSEIRPIIISAQDFRRDISRGVVNPKAFSIPPLYSSREVSIHIDRRTKTKYAWFTESKYCFDLSSHVYEVWEHEIGFRGMGTRFMFIALPDPQIDNETGIDLTVGFVTADYQVIEVDVDVLRRAASQPHVQPMYHFDIDWEEQVKWKSPQYSQTDLIDASVIAFGIPPHLLTGDIP